MVAPTLFQGPDRRTQGSSDRSSEVMFFVLLPQEHGIPLKMVVDAVAALPFVPVCSVWPHLHGILAWHHKQ
jgi:hypothetical protein